MVACADLPTNILDKKQLHMMALDGGGLSTERKLLERGGSRVYDLSSK
jgi:hypothetical protein